MSNLPIYGSPEWLEGLQALLIVGWMLIAGGAILDNAIAARSAILARQKPKDNSRGFELCKLHSRPIGTCPPGSHEE